MATTTTVKRAELLRFVNDTLYDHALQLAEKTVQRFLCECDDEACQRTVWLPLKTYARRPDRPLTAHD